MDSSARDKKEYESAKSATLKFTERYNDFMDLAYARIPEAKGFKSRVSTGDLSNLVIERNARVASKIPTGKIVPISEDDGKKASLINMAWNNYVLQKADWQYPMSIKLRMWDYYSLVCGISAMFHGYRVDEKYTGPDCRVVDLKFLFPQAGRLSPNDVDYVFHETFHSKKDLKKMIGQEGWDDKNLISLIEDHSKEPQLSSEQYSSIQKDRGEDEKLNSGQIKLITKYVKGADSNWVTYDKDFNKIREIKNPFESGRIPFVFKLAFPLIDSFWGLGDIERGESLQRAINTVTNLSLDYLKTMIFPPMLMSSGMSAAKYPLKPAANWKIDRQNGEFIETANLNQAPANIVQQLNQGFKGALLNQNGTTDTTISSSDGLPGFGKTPDALKKLDARESSRDNFDRQMYEAACRELFEGMLEEFSTRQELPVVFEIFERQIQELEAEGFENFEKVNDNFAKITISPEDLEGGFRFLVDIGSSAENDKEEEFERIKAVVDMIESPFGQKAIEAMEKRGETVDYKLIFEQFLVAANIKNREQMVIAFEQPKSTENEIDYSEDYDDSMITDPKLKSFVGGVSQ